MAETMMIGQLLKPMRAAFKTIDIRVAAVRDGSKWVNGLTAIRVTRLSKEDVVNTQEMLTAKWGEVNLDRLTILMDTVDFGEWDRLVASIANGNLRISGLDVAYPESVDIAMLESRGFGLQRESYWPHRVGQGIRQEDIQWEEFDSDLIRSKKPLTTIQALNTLLGLESHTSNNRTQIYVGVPIYATVRHDSFSTAGCEIDAEFHEELEDLLLTVFTSIGDSPALRDSKTVELALDDSIDLGDGLRRMKKTVLLDAREHDKLNIRLIHTEAALEIESSRREIRYLLQPDGSEGSPLLTIFPSFCDYDVLESYLTHPSRDLAKNAGIAGGPAHLFEYATGWLLTLMGFRVVNLGGTNHERLDGDPMMTTDIIGFHDQRKVIILAGCTISDPPNADFDKLMRSREEVARRVAESNSIIIPAIFTSLRVTVAKDAGMKHGVRVIDADDTRSVVALLKVGDVARALGECLEIWGPLNL